MMRVRRSISATLAALASFTFIGVGSSTADSPAADPTIQDFANRVHQRWRLQIDPSDYEIRTDRDGTRFIARRDEIANIVSETSAVAGTGSANDRAFTTVVTVGSAIISDVDEPSDSAAQNQADGVRLGAPHCYARLGDEYGWMDTCRQNGTITYSDEIDLINLMWASCGNHDDAWFTEVDECYVEIDPTPLTGVDPTPEWRDWSPKSTIDLGGCGNISLSVGVGPVSASWNGTTCEKLVPTKGRQPGDMKTTWVGDAYWDDDVRETALMTIMDGAYQMKWNWGYRSSECNPPPDLIDQCG